MAAQLVGGMALMLAGLFTFSSGLAQSSPDFYSHPKQGMMHEALTDAELEERIASGDDLVVIAFAPWCIACKRFAAVYDKAKAQLGDRLVSYNSDAGSAVPDVSAFPTLVRYRGGVELERVEGGMPLEKFITFAQK